MQNRKISKVAVLGSGVMGSRIACHFANIGVEVLLLDIVPKEPNAAEAAKGLTTEHPAVRNRIVNDALNAAVASNPSPLYKKAFASRIKTGNFDDNLKDIAAVDWIIEVVVENLAIKKSVFENVEKFRKPGTIVSSNTSGIPISMMAEGRSEDFQKNFCVTHFFNPPRYLKLLEIVPSKYTDPELTAFLMHYGDLFLGKDTVLCKDTPAFIANRIGIFSIMDVIYTALDLGLSVEEVDKLTGPVIGHPKSATFRTADVVGLDTLIKVAQGLFQGLPNDESRDLFKLPDLLIKLDDKKWYGDKSGQGFYKKTKNASGQTEILSLDLNTLEYKTQAKAKFATLEQTKTIDDLKSRFKVLVSGTDKAGEFYKRTFFNLFKYVSNRIPEISDELFRIDAAMCAGFGWELGPFEIWNAMGVEKTTTKMKEAGYAPASWLDEMLASGATSFYKVEDGKRKYYDIPSKTYKVIPGTEQFILLDNTRATAVWKNAGATLHDIGDGVVNLEFHSKMNTLGGEVIEAINKGISIAEKDFKGIVIANEGANFSAGANLALLLMNAVEQEYDEIDFMIRTFQKTMMRARYSSIPVVVAPHSMALGGGCEITLHADRVQATAELYMGLVEMGVGLIPGGGGTKEMTMRMADGVEDGDIIMNSLRNAFLTIGQAKVSTSAHEAFELGFLRRGDGISVSKNRQIVDAKAKVLELAHAGYTQPTPRKDIKVLGKSGLGMVYAGANSMFSGGYISEYDKYLSEKLGYIMCGGDLSAPTMVSEQYLLDLERETFLHLCGQKKTLERIQHMLTTGKPLRN